MNTWIALLRGINVGGNNILPMKDLRQLLEHEGFTDAKTYIQSGNCVFQSDLSSPDEIQCKISDGIENKFGFRPRIFVMDRSNLLQAIAANPYPEGAEDPKSVHFYFLAGLATEPDLEALEAIQAPTERYLLTDHVLYLHAPDGIGRSKFAAQVEQKLGVATTARNFRTVLKIAELLQ